MKKSFTTVDEYIQSFPVSTQKLLKQLRTLVQKAAPKVEEVLSYHMPAYKQHGIVVYFAAYAKHIGFYPMPGAIKEFKKDIAVYKSARGSVQFPLDKPLPTALITKMVKFRVKENLQKMEAKKKK
jgi:uncharacterized protein YdhG (YjbR/CyaY superfamily)